MDEVESVADNDERKLVRQLSLLQEVLDLLRVVEIALSADTFDFTDLSSARSGLNVLEVNLRILADVDDGTKVVIKT